MRSSPYSSRADNKSLETFDTHVKLMLDSGMADAHMIAARTMDVLESALSGRYLNCAQLALIAYKFPEGAELHNDYATHRVELIVRLFSRLVDVVNFDYVLKELDQGEYAMVVYRLGQCCCCATAVIVVVMVVYYGCFCRYSFCTCVFVLLTDW